MVNAFGCWRSIQGPARRLDIFETADDLSPSTWQLALVSSSPDRIILAARKPLQIVYAEDDIPSSPRWTGRTGPLIGR